jgi:hypothetical protein
MAQTKSLHAKSTKIHPAPEAEDELKDPQIQSDKKVIDPDLILDTAPLDEKIDDEIVAPTEETDESGDELSLDDEELNPFGDKWEQ